MRIHIFWFACLAGVMLFTSGVDAQVLSQWRSCTGIPDVDWGEQVKSCTSIIESGSVASVSLAIAHLNRGAAYSALGDYDNAIADNNEAIKLNPKFGQAYSNRANEYFAKGDNDSAIADANKAIEIDPGLAKAYTNRGAAYFAQGANDQAIADANKAIELDPNFAPSYLNRGNAYRAKGDIENAIANYNDAIKLNPNLALTYYDRGNAYVEKGDIGSALADYDEAIKLNPNLKQTYLNRGNARLALQDYDGAITDYNEAIKFNPQRSTVLGRGIAYLYSGNLAQAFADVSQASNIDPKDAYSALWVDIVAHRNNVPGHLSQAIVRIEMVAWPAPIVRMYLGQLTPTSVLEGADDPDLDKKKGQICEANFYSGELALRHGAKDEATRLFRLAASGCPNDFIEWDAANAELKVLAMP